jgi:predicted ribosomally synthesized peptide with SipW-like signal peptide
MMAAFAAGATWSYLSDSESSTGNSVTAGTLDLVSTVSGSYSGLATHYQVTSGSNGVNGNVVFDLIIPGETGTVTWTLTNTGSVSGTLTIASVCTYAENGTVEPEEFVTGNDGGFNGDLDQYVGVKLTLDGSYILGSASYYVPLSGLEAALDDAIGQSLAAGGTITYILHWSTASDIKGAGTDGLFGTIDDVDVNDNIIQSDTATIDITFTLTQ